MHAQQALEQAQRDALAAQPTPEVMLPDNASQVLKTAPSAPNFPTTGDILELEAQRPSHT